MSNETIEDTIEGLLPALLSEAAERVTPEVDLREHLHARLAHQLSVAQPRNTADPAPSAQHASWRSSARAIGRRPALVAGGLVAVLLLVSAFAFARPLVLSWFGDSGLRSIALQDGTPINRSVTVQGVTLTLEDGYADAARTVLTMHISSGDSKRVYSPAPQDPRPRLVDAQGNIYTPFTSSQLNEDALWEFLPLPSMALGTPQELTFVVAAMSSEPSNPNSPGTVIPGPWQVTFSLRPQAGTVIFPDAAPQTHGGITLQPERLDLTPAGARLLVRESGLPPDTSIFSVKHFATQVDDIEACPPGQHVCSSTGGTGDGSRMRLSAPGGQTLVPGWIQVVSPAVRDGMPIASQTIGPAGTAELAFLFFSPVTTAHGTVRATFDEVRFSSATDASAPEQIVAGPWSFDLALP